MATAEVALAVEEAAAEHMAVIIPAKQTTNSGEVPSSQNTRGAGEQGRDAQIQYVCRDGRGRQSYRMSERDSRARKLEFLALGYHEAVRLLGVAER